MYWFFAFLLSSTLFFASDVLAAADSNCQARFSTLKQYHDRESDCFEDAEFNYNLGLLALSEGRYSMAVSAFERVVVLDTQHAGAWLDMAEAYLLLGDRDGVYYAIAELEKRFPIPQGLTEVIARYKKWYRERRPVYVQRGGAFLSQGYSDNINGGSSRQNIDLEFGGQVIRIGLDENSQSIADGYSDVGGYWQLDYNQFSETSNTKGDSYYLRLSANKRFYDTETEYDSGIIMINGGRAFTSKRERLSMNVGTIFYSQRGKVYQQGLLLGLQYDKRFSQYSAFRVQLACDHNRYRSSGISDVDKCSYQLKLKRDFDFGELSATLLSGVDMVSGFRPGGDTLWYGARLGWLYSFSDSTLSVYARYEQEEDEEPYSTEIFGDRKRDKITTAYGVGYEFFFTKRASVELSASASTTTSDIVLFDTEQNKAALSFYYYW